MKQDEIIEMARQAGFDEGLVLNVYPNFIQRFAKLVAAKEREACARICDELHYEAEDNTGLAADSIRARGEA